MPELPEVETIRRDLDRRLRDHAVVEASFHDPRLFTPAAFAQWKKQVLGQPWRKLQRQGKYLFAELESQWRIGFHLRMTGQLVLGELPRPAKPRLVMTFDHGVQLRFYDQRRFGEVWLLAPGQNWHGTRLLGPDALDELDLPTFTHLLKGRTTRIQPLLMDQQRLAGVGNIYAQEALFKAGIRPSRAAGRIRPVETEKLFRALGETLREAIEHRGSTSRDYRDALGEKGTAQTLHFVYRKGGQPCRRCASTLKAMRVGGRGTVYCPQCQH